MDNKARILWITRTAVFVALLVVAQLSTAPLGNQYVTGSIVNLLLIVSVMTCGLASGITVAVMSPICAKLIGIGPLWSLIPFIMLGNAAIVVVWRFFGRLGRERKYAGRIPAVIMGAAAKLAVLYFGIVQLAVPIILKLPEPQAAVISAMFSLPQFVTALIGGSLAALLLPSLDRVLKREDK